LARPQHDAVTPESNVVAHLPLTALDDHGRCAVVEAHAPRSETGPFVAKARPTKFWLLIERDLGGRKRGGERAHDSRRQRREIVFGLRLISA
jgi:hypothetical protein